jgi:hypothetical protein
VRQFEARLDDEDDWHAIEGFDADDAASEYAERVDLNSAHEEFADGPRTVHVREPRTGGTWSFRVTCEYSPTYHTEPL